MFFFREESFGYFLRAVHLVRETVRERLNYIVQQVKGKELSSY